MEQKTSSWRRCHGYRPLNTADLGFTLCHEHVLACPVGFTAAFPEFIDLQATSQSAVRDLSQARQEGVTTIIDPCPYDQGRGRGLLEEVSRLSGVNIIASTGTWMDISPFLAQVVDPDRIAKLYIREIEEGIEGTGIKAGIIKVANDRGGATAVGELVLRAAARAQKATGVPIITHTWVPERVGEQQVAIFKDEGVDMNGVIIGHSNDSTDMGYLIGLLEEGVWLGMDRHPVGPPGSPGWKTRASTVKALIDAGWGHRVVLGHDWDSTIGLRGPEQQAERETVNPDAYLFITRNVLPRLKELGATDEDIHTLTVDNPRRMYEGRQ